MKIAVDTNVLIRAVVRDDPAQARAAIRLLTDATLVAVAIPCLCEFSWVLRKVYGFAPREIAAAIRALMGAANVVLNRPAAESGLTILEAGGDFADGVIAYEGRWLGGETFVSFDRKAVSLLRSNGQPASTPGA